MSKIGLSDVVQSYGVCYFTSPNMQSSVIPLIASVLPLPLPFSIFENHERRPFIAYNILVGTPYVL
jgi:hypothetical protein